MLGLEIEAACEILVSGTEQHINRVSTHYTIELFRGPHCGDFFNVAPFNTLRFKELKEFKGLLVFDDPARLVDIRAIKVKIGVFRVKIITSNDINVILVIRGILCPEFHFVPFTEKHLVKSKCVREIPVIFVPVIIESVHDSFLGYI
jgi:hypothetical protein